MKRVVQTRTGSDGNCLNACIASILELPLSKVPEFGDDWIEDLNEFLTTKGLSYRRVPMYQKPSGYSTIEGVSPRGGLHACVAKDGELVWDPHPIEDGTGQGLVEPRYYGLLESVRVSGGDWTSYDASGLLSKAEDASFSSKVKNSKSVNWEGDLTAKSFLKTTANPVLSNGPREPKKSMRIPLDKVVGIQDYLLRDKLLDMYKAPLSALQEPVPVVAKGDKFYLQNGHHRAAVLKARGQKYINAIVEYQTRAKDRADMQKLRSNTENQGGPFFIQETTKSGQERTIPVRNLSKGADVKDLRKYKTIHIPTNTESYHALKQDAISMARRRDAVLMQRGKPDERYEFICEYKYGTKRR